MYYLLYNNKYLYDVIDSVMYVFMYYKIECKLVDEICDDEKMYIIFTINNIEKLPKNYIVYNFEQLVTKREWGESFFTKCSKAKFIFDYSLENIKVFQKKGLKAIHFPFGWTPFHENNDIIKSKDIDFIFFGSKSSRRNNILDKINNIIYQDNVFGEKYDNLVSRAKISFNVHYYDGSSILEITRIIPLISRDVLVISERSNDKYYDEKLEDIVIFFDKIDDINLKDILLKYNRNKCLRNKVLLLERLDMVGLNLDKINLLKYI